MPAQLPLPPLIPNNILTKAINLQPQSALLTKLPTEILDRILLFSTHDATDIITRVFISLSSKLMALSLANASGQKSTLANVRKREDQRTILKAGSRPLLRKDTPKNFYSKHAPTAVQTARMNFMVKLSSWLRVEYGWVFCATCTVYKRLGWGLGAETASWRSMKKVITSEKEREKGKETGGEEGDDDCDREDVDLEGAGIGKKGVPIWMQHQMTEEGWARLSEEWMICPKHRLTLLQMIGLRES